MKNPTPILAWFAVAATLGCTAAPPPGTAQPLADLGGGTFEAHMVSTLDPGLEIERCQLFVVPPGGLNIHSETVTFTPGSHHVLLFSTPYTAVPTMDRNGAAIDPSAVFDCPDGAFGRFDVDGVIGGSQSMAAAPMELPDGAALELQPGAVVILNTHYLNATQQPVQAEATIDLQGIPADQVTVEAGIAFFYDLEIRVPPLGASTARLRCPVTRDIQLLSAQSHMHRRGVHYVAQIDDGAGNPLETIYQNDSWQNVPVQTWPGGKPVAAGSQIDYRCDYQNGEDRTILQGLTTKDEMCMFIGAYTPRDRTFELCSLDGTIWTESLAGTYVGSGAATCAATLDCFASAPPSSADQGAGFTGCLVDSCAGAAKPVTDFWLGCWSSQGHGACKDACGDGDNHRAQCMQCLLSACPSEVAACQAAVCN